MDNIIKYLKKFNTEQYLPLQEAYKHAESERLRYREMCQQQHRKIKKLENRISKMEAKRMIELTKEECIEALEEFSELDIKHNDRTSGYIWREDISCKGVQVLKQLIKEHFELKEKHEKYVERFTEYEIEMQELQDLLLKKCLNKPLKFEDLKPNMWVWDNKYKEWLQIQLTSILEIVDGKVEKLVGFGNKSPVENYMSGFEENRFFAREVKENGS